MATTPTITLATDGVSVTVTINTTVNTDTISVWRTDEAGQFIKLSAGVTLTGSAGDYSGTFEDGNAESYRSYSYYALATDGSAGTAQSVVKQATLILDSTTIHLCTKSDPDRNVYQVDGVDQSLAVIDPEPHSRAYGFAATDHAFAQTGLALKQSAIQEVRVGVSVIVKRSQDSDRLILQRMAESNAVACLRPQSGGKYFGELMEYGESYEFNTDVPLAFERRQFDEAVA